jgi:mono/diheme cytochrome c family protein
MNASIRSCVLALTALAPLSPAFAADAPAVEHGNGLFQYHCAPCHGKGPGERGAFLPGTNALNVKYQGKLPGALEDRTDLLPELVTYIIRHGIEGMPFFRKTEISDADAAAIGAYLARNNKPQS